MRAFICSNINKLMKNLLFICFISGLFGCGSVNKSMFDASNSIELQLDDFIVTNQLSAQASSTKILMIDFERLFNKEMASPTLITILGPYSESETAKYALNELISSNPGYDVILYPQYETTILKPFFGLGFIYNITTVKSTARFGKLITPQEFSSTASIINRTDIKSSNTTESNSTDPSHETEIDEVVNIEIASSNSNPCLGDFLYFDSVSNEEVYLLNSDCFSSTFSIIGPIKFTDISLKLAAVSPDAVAPNKRDLEVIFNLNRPEYSRFRTNSGGLFWTQESSPNIENAVVFSPYGNESYQLNIEEKAYLIPVIKIK